MNAAVLTISDGVHHGTREDTSGDTLAELLAADGFAVERRIVPDERRRDRRRDHRPRRQKLLVLTTGGTGFSPRDVTPEATRTVLDREAPGIARRSARRADPNPARDALARPRRPPRSHVVVNMPGSPGGCRDGFAVLRPALVHGLELAAGDQGSTPRADMSATALSLPRRFASLVKFEHTVFALPFAYVGAFLAVDGYPGPPRPHLAHARDGRRPDARDGAQPAHRRRAGRAQPAHRLARDPGRLSEPGAGLALCGAALALYLVAAFPARPDRALALADPGRDVRHLPLFEADYVALPPVARGLHRARAARRLARRDRLCAVGGMGALRRAGSLGRRLRPLLLALRPRARPGRRACAPGPRASASAACSPAHASSTSPPLLLPRRRRRRSRRATSSTGSASLAVAGLLVYEHTLVRPGDLRRLDAAFFTVNGVISVVFFIFVVLATTV